jgi:hypothetical protein
MHNPLAQFGTLVQQLWTARCEYYLGEPHSQNSDLPRQNLYRDISFSDYPAPRQCAAERKLFPQQLILPSQSIVDGIMSTFISRKATCTYNLVDCISDFSEKCNVQNRKELVILSPSIIK